MALSLFVAGAGIWLLELVYAILIQFPKRVPEGQTSALTTVKDCTNYVGTILNLGNAQGLTVPPPLSDRKGSKRELNRLHI